MDAGTALLDRIVTYLIDPAVKVVFTLGLFMFLWGIVEFLWALKDGKVQDTGKDHILDGRFLHQSRRRTMKTIVF